MENVQCIGYVVGNLFLIAPSTAGFASVIITCKFILSFAKLICSNVHSCDSFVSSINNACTISLMFQFSSIIINKLKAISYLLVLHVTSYTTTSEYWYHNFN